MFLFEAVDMVFGRGDGEFVVLGNGEWEGFEKRFVMKRRAKREDIEVCLRGRRPCIRV